MSMIRACSYVAAIKTPIAPSQYERILVTLEQEGNENKINKEKTDLTLQSDSVVVQLTQAETKQFTAPGVVMLQIRAFKSVYEAPGSRIWAIPVYPALNDEILSAPAQAQEETT